MRGRVWWFYPNSKDETRYAVLVLSTFNIVRQELTYACKNHISNAAGFLVTFLPHVLIVST